jgi:hypothetical protein
MRPLAEARPGGTGKREAQRGGSSSKESWRVEEARRGSPGREDALLIDDPRDVARGWRVGVPMLLLCGEEGRGREKLGVGG